MSTTLRYLTAIFVIALVTACVPPAKVAVQRAPEAGSIAEKTATTVKLTIFVQNQAGTPMRGLNVSVTSGSEKDSEVTGPAGQAYLKVSHFAGAPLDVDFNSDTVRWTDRVSVLPEGVSEVTIYFRVDPLGKVLFTRLEY